MGSARWGTSQKGAEERGKETAAQGMRWRERWWWGQEAFCLLLREWGFILGKEGSQGRVLGRRATSSILVPKKGPPKATGTVACRQIRAEAGRPG